MGTFLSVCVNPTLQKTLCFDRVVFGEVNRTALHRLDTAGKGLNVARVLSQAGKKAVHLTHLGGSLRQLFIALCERDNLDLRWVESGSAIRFCYTLITGASEGAAGDGCADGGVGGEDGDAAGCADGGMAGGHAGSRTVTELVEEGEPVAPGTEERLLAAYTELLASAGTVIVCGTKARGYSGALVPAMVRMAREQGKRVILDIRGKDLRNSLPYRPDVIKPNLFEFAGTFAEELAACAASAGVKPPDYSGMGELSGDEPGVRANITAYARELAARYNTAVVLTRGKRPVWFTDGDGLGECPVGAAPVVNTVGSGDAFTAGLAAALDDGLPLAEAVANGARFGGLNAGLLRPGVIRED